MSATNCKATVHSDLIFLPDSLSNRVFLPIRVPQNIVPYKSQACPFDPTLWSTSGASISAWSYKTLQVKFSKTRFNHWFLLADVANPILGWTSSQSSTCLFPPPPPTHQVLFASSLENILQTGTRQGSPSASSAANQASPPQGSPLASQLATQQVDSTTLPSQVEKLLREFPGLL